MKNSFDMPMHEMNSELEEAIQDLELEAAEDLALDEFGDQEYISASHLLHQINQRQVPSRRWGRLYRSELHLLRQAQDFLRTFIGSLSSDRCR